MLDADRADCTSQPQGAVLRWLEGGAAQRPCASGIVLGSWPAAANGDNLGAGDSEPSRREKVPG